MVHVLNVTILGIFHARACAVQEENMVSNKELASKYQSAEDFEDDFM